MNENKLVHCFDEINEIKKVFSNNSTLKISEKRGTVKIRSNADRYETSFTFTVPDFYPADPVEFVLNKSTFPHRYFRMFIDHADAMRRKLALGFTEEYIFRQIDSSEGRQLKEITEIDTSKFDKQDLVTLRNDIRLLSHISDLRHAQKDNTKARRELKDINRFGMKAVHKHLEKLNADQKRLHELENSRDPNPSLAIIAKYLVNRCFQELIKEKCQGCNKYVIPRDPKKLIKMEEDVFLHNKNKYPQRALCGHWFHHQCLHEFMTIPPFAKPCPTCEIQVRHPLWSDNVADLERTWANKQAYERELDDCDDFLGSDYEN